MDFFTMPTITFGVLYCFFIIAHDRRPILHFNVTTHPTSLWIFQQLREAFPFDLAPRFLIFDRDVKYATLMGRLSMVLGKLTRSRSHASIVSVPIVNKVITAEMSSAERSAILSRPSVNFGPAFDQEFLWITRTCL